MLPKEWRHTSRCHRMTWRWTPPDLLWGNLLPQHHCSVLVGNLDNISLSGGVLKSILPIIDTRIFFLMITRNACDCGGSKYWYPINLKISNIFQTCYSSEVPDWVNVAPLCSPVVPDIGLVPQEYQVVSSSSVLQRVLPTRYWLVASVGRSYQRQ